jgi:hypothetical protein
MGMFSAYFDASGHPDALGKVPAFYVSGFVSTVAKWEKFEKAWPELLAEFDIPSPFHTADFMARKGRFESWSGDNARRDAFRIAAIHLLHRTTNKPFAIGVVIPDFRRLFSEYEVPAEQPREPYPWCALKACDYLFDWIHHRVRAGTVSGKDQMQIVFEKGDIDQGKFADALWAKHRLEVAFQTNHGKTLLPFAACDFLAWEFRNWMSKREQGMLLWQEAKRDSVANTRRATLRKAAPLIKPDPVIMELARRLPPDALGYANWDVLVRMCNKKGWPRK